MMVEAIFAVVGICIAVISIVGATLFSVCAYKEIRNMLNK